MVVLDTGEMPDEPRDRVGGAVDTEGEILSGKTFYGAVHRVTDAPERIGKDFCTRHLFSPPRP
jgi:hypothetical protein